MKSQLNKILKFTLVILFFSLSKSYSVEDLSEFTDAISEAREGFDQVSAASTDQSKIIDEAFKEIDKATAIAQEAINNENTEDAIKTLEFVERALTDVESIIPQEFSSDMSKIDATAIPKEDMDTINELTAQMKSSKAVKEKEFKSNLIEINLKGIDTASISEKLNELGVNTIQLDIVLDKDKKIETWTKQDWADAYTGSILTYDGKEVVADKAVNSRMAELEEKFQKNAALIESKKNELSLLNSQLNPVNVELETLNERKSLLTAQYNLEIEKLSTVDLTNVETQKSIEISDKLKSELDNIAGEVSEVEKKSATLKEDISKLNLEINVEREALNKISSDIANSQKELNNTLAAVNAKQSQLDNLLNNDLSKTNQVLNQQLSQVTREKDFIEAKFEQSIDKEVEALERYYSALGDIDSEYFEDEMEFSLREVGVILDADPRKARAFDIERYGTYAGLSQDAIQRGIDAVNKDDWETQGDVFKEIYTGLSKNKEWVVDVPTAAELRVMVEEEKAIQAATLASLNIETINKGWNEKLKEEAKQFESLAQLNTNTLKYAATYKGMKEHEVLQNEIDNILTNNQDFQIKQNKMSGIKNSISQLQNTVNNFNKNERDKLYAEYEKSIEVSKINFEKQIKQANIDFQNLQEEIREHNRNANWRSKEWIDKRQNLYSKHVENFYDRFDKFSPEEFVDPTATEIAEINKLNSELSVLNSDVISIKNQVTQEARTSVVQIVEESKTKYNEIMSKENPEYTAVKSKVTSILKDVPTFADKADSLAGLDAVSLRAQLADLSAGTKTETAALAAARKAMSEMGKTTGSEFMTGPYWEMSNVKAAAIVRSKKFEHVDDYAYINAYYEEPLQLETKDRKEVEEGFKEFLAKDNPKLNALNEKTANLKSEIATNNAQLSTISADITKIEKEIGTIKSSEKDLKSQIASLNKDLASKQSLIDQKTQSLSDLQNNLDPINDKITELETQKSELDTNIQNEINAISQNLEKSPTAKSTEIDKLNADYKARIASLDEQISNFENQAKDLNQTAKAINDEIKSYEIETPQITEQITNLSKEMQSFTDIKANLAMATAKNIGIKVDEKAIKSLGKLEGKAIISIKGTQLVRVVDENFLKDKAKDFIDPISTFSLNTKVYSTEALKPEVFAAVEITSSYSKAKTAREIARENLAAVEAKSGASKEEIQAAEAAVAEAKYAEIAAGQAYVSNRGLASAISQKQTLENLKAIRSTPGMNKWDVRRTEAAIKAAEAQIAGKSFNYDQALGQINSKEKQWNVWRADLYNKDIEAAKAAGKLREAAELQKDLQNFQTRLVDERKAFESIQAKQSEYLNALNNVAVQSAALTGVSLQDTSNAINAAGKTASVSSEVRSSSSHLAAYDAAKAAREKIDANMNSLRASGASKEAIQAAEAARHAALQTEISAANAVAANKAAVEQAVQSAQAAASSASTAAQSAAEAATTAAAEAAQETLAALQEVANTPGMSQWDVQRAQAAVKAAEAEIAGTEYNLDHALNTIEQNKAYEEAGGTPNQSGRSWDGH